MVFSDRRPISVSPVAACMPVVSHCLLSSLSAGFSSWTVKRSLRLPLVVPPIVKCTLIEVLLIAQLVFRSDESARVLKVLILPEDLDKAFQRLPDQGGFASSCMRQVAIVSEPQSLRQL